MNRIKNIFKYVLVVSTLLWTVIEIMPVKSTFKDDFQIYECVNQN